MSDVQILRNALEQAARRRQWQRGWNGLWRGLLVGSLIFLVALAAYKAFPIPFEVVNGAAAAGVVCLLVGFVWGWLRKMSLVETARWLDEKQHLEERLSTALEVGEKPIEHKWQELVTSDAARHVEGIDPRKLLPFHLPSASHWVVLVLAVAAGLGFIPEYRSKDYVQRQSEKAVIKEVGKKLVEVTRRELAARPPALEPTHQAMESVEQLGNVLGQKPVTKDAALKDLASVTEKLKSELKEIAKNPSLKPLERAARASSQSGNSLSGDLQKQMDTLQKALGDKMGSPDALDKMKEQLDQMKQAAANGLPDKNSPEGQAARQQMAQQLADMARQMQDMGQSLAGLEEAISALQANQADVFYKDLDMAWRELEKMRDMAKQLQQMQQQAGQKLGKDLAEQLKNGQAEAAQGTLQKMIDELKSQNLSQEQLKKILDDVAKAVDPASPYGKVADHLKQAASQLQKGDKPNGSQSLAKASDELKKLLEQMNDAQSLAATLDALKKAQMCVGNCQSWGQCKGQPKAGKGGKPGRGVGTWAEETGWLYYPEVSERWDNSGLERPDMDPRGLTDRGDPKLADNLKGEKIRGQMSPGPMPSITLKGVSIKGQSSVQYQEAVGAAQSEAQAAINQDQVPRAYRGAVRDYFDDLKK